MLQLSGFVIQYGTFTTITMWFGEYNVRNQKHGLNVILLDHVSFGGSGGAVRQSINSCGQAKDYQYIVDFVRTLVNKKNGKLVLLGDSFFETFKANFEAREFR